MLRLFHKILGETIGIGFKIGKLAACSLTLSPLAVNFEDLMTFANNLDPDEAPQNDSDYISAKKWVETMNILKILKETNI